MIYQHCIRGAVAPNLPLPKLLVTLRYECVLILTETDIRRRSLKNVLHLVRLQNSPAG